MNGGEMNNEKAERIERSIAEVAQEVYALGLEMQENQKRINEIMATEATDRPDYMRIHNIVPQIRKKVEELAGRRNELLKNLRGQLASEVEAYPTVRAEIAKIDAEMDKNREIMNNTRPTGFSRNRFYAAVHENERLQGRKDMIINKGVDDRLAMMGIGANETLLNSDNNAEGVSVEGGANGAGASNVAANEAGDVAAETEGEAVTGAEPATVEAEGEPVVEEEIVETGESVSEDEGVNESASENEGAGEQNDDGENLSELRDAYEIVAEETLDRQKKLINYLEGVNGDELNEEELRKIDELTEAVNRMMETWERDGDNLKTIGGEAEYRTVEDDKNEILSNVDEYRNNPAFVKYQEMRFGDGEGGVGESGNDESGNDESGEDVEIDEAFERDEQKFADIEKELGGEALKMIAVDTGANAAALENLARQMAVDELAFAKRQRAGEMAKASGLAKLKLIAKGALLENSLIRNIRLGRKKKEIFENMQATGSAYAKWVHDENGDRVSNYNEMTGTAGDRGIIERFKNYIRAGVDESMMGEGDEMSGAEDGEKTEALKARLSGMVDKIVAGDEGAWGEYQNWVRESRENGFFTGQEGRKENRNFSADNIMSMGDKVRKMAEQYKDNEDALAKIREYVANNTALYMAKAEVGINTEVKLDQMGTMIANIGLPATLVASAVGRAAKSNVMKGLTVGASAAIAGGFGGVKGFFDARATMSQVDVAQALGGDRDMEKAGTGMFAKSKGSKEKLETYKTISVDEILGESGLGRIMERDEEGNWRLKEGVENNEETMRELAGIVGNLRAALAVGSERNVDLVTYNVDEGGDLGQIEEQKTQLNWAMAEAMRLLRENSSEENNYTDLVEAAESERALGYNEEIDEINRSRKEYQMDVIAKTAAMAAFAGGTVRFAKTVALPWLQENHPEALPNIMRGAKAANKVSSVAGAEDAKDAIDGISEDLANAGMEGGGQPKTSLNAIINALSIRRGVGASVENGEAGYTGAQVDIAMNAAVGTDGNGGGDVEIDTLRSVVPNTSNSGIAMRLKDDGNYEMLGDLDGDGEFEKIKGLGKIEYNADGRMKRSSMERIREVLGFDRAERVGADGTVAREDLGGGNVLNLAGQNLGEKTVEASDVRVEGNDYVINVWQSGNENANVEEMKYFIRPNAEGENSVLSYDIRDGEVRIPRDSVGGRMFSTEGDGSVSFNGNTQGVMEVDANNYGTVRVSASGNNTAGEINLTESEQIATGGNGNDVVFTRTGENGETYTFRVDAPSKQYANWVNNMEEFDEVHYRTDGLGRTIELTDKVEMQNGEDLHRVANIGGHSIDSDFTYRTANKLESFYEAPPLGRGIVEGDGRITAENIGQVDAGQLWQKQLSRFTTSARKSEILDVAMGDRPDMNGGVAQINGYGKLYEMNDMEFDKYNNSVIDKFVERSKNYTPRISVMEGGHRSSTYVRMGENGEMIFTSSPNVANRDTDVILTMDKMENGRVVDTMFKDTPELRKILGTPENAIVHQTGYNPNCGQIVQTWDYPEGQPGEPGIPEEEIGRSIEVKEDQLIIDDSTEEHTNKITKTKKAIKKVKKQKVVKQEEEVIRRKPVEPEPETKKPTPEPEPEPEPKPKPEPEPEDDKPKPKPTPEDETDKPKPKPNPEEETKLDPKNPEEAGNMNNGYADVEEVKGEPGEDMRDDSRTYNRETGTYDDNSSSYDNPAAGDESTYDQSGADRESTTLTEEQQAENQEAIDAQIAADNEYPGQDQAAKDAIDQGQASIAEQQEREGGIWERVEENRNQAEAQTLNPQEPQPQMADTGIEQEAQSTTLQVNDTSAGGTPVSDNTTDVTLDNNTMESAPVTENAEGVPETEISSEPEIEDITDEVFESNEDESDLLDDWDMGDDDFYEDMSDTVDVDDVADEIEEVDMDDFSDFEDVEEAVEDVVEDIGDTGDVEEMGE